MAADDHMPSERGRFVRLLTSADAMLFERGGAEGDDLEAAFGFFRDRGQAGPRVRLRRASGGLGFLDVLNDDRPFLVDSVLAELQARQIKIAAFAHPIVRVERDAAGRLQSFGGQDHPGRAESWMVARIEPMMRPDAEALTTAIVAVLADVAAVTDDFGAMLARVASAAETVTDPVDQAFVRWLLDGNLVLMAVTGGSEGAPALGLARQDPLLLAATGAQTRVRVTKSARVSSVHRRAPLDVIEVPVANGRQPMLIAGLFTSKAYTATARSIPLLRDKIERVLGSSGFPPGSHGGKALVNILDTFPRDELFEIDTESLGVAARGILDLEIRPRVRLFLRADARDRRMSALLYAPRDAWTTRARTRVGEHLARALSGRVTDYQPFFLEGPMLRAHFVIERESRDVPTVDVGALERDLAATLRTFEDRLTAALEASGGDAQALRGRYIAAFPADYAEVLSAERALEDVRRMEHLRTSGEPVAVDFYLPDVDAAPGHLAVAVSRYGQPIRLSERVPVLENLGFAVIDERSYVLTPRTESGVRPVALHHMRLQSADGTPVDLGQVQHRLEAAFAAVVTGAAENDVFNGLVLKAGADWREAALLRGYAGYLRQLNVPFGLRALGDTLVRHGGVARDLVEAFHVKFDPQHRSGDLAERRTAFAAVKARIEGALAGVSSLDEDRMLRLFLAAIEATVRTNYHRHDAGGRPADEIALKFDPAGFDAVPLPRPYREIWVSSPRIDGTHLRFAPIARGGLRWSDRAGDVRTEVLGLVRAQRVKNAVIVPSGAKGGFVPKKLPRAGARDEIMAEGVAAYRRFVGAMLDVTDNTVDGRIVPPPQVVRHDGDDPYLVVAADKGTATFSDIANALSVERGHWLGDAFASGGSVGYDHKKMAITARGAWECVKRHFRERDIDIQSQAFMVAGVGDMSGDVFGNGMLLSPMIRLVAAFDHRDIMLDPDPDPKTSFAERKRLFELPRSSWQDYDRSLLSEGGMIVSRAAKRIALTPQVQARLGLTAGDATPHDLMRAILKAQVDLLWFGGIGTYVRAATETDEQVGDRANDGVRVTADEIRAQVIGEGANLALTQRGRIELAARGVRLNTDFIDNSAGVNSSDLEVNIKIGLGPAVGRGELDAAARAAFLASMTDAVAQRCLVANRGQSLALSLAERDAARGWREFAALMRHLEVRGLLDRKLEALPDDGALETRTTAKRPLTRPELATLLSYAKIAMTDDLLASTFPDQPLVAGFLTTALPAPLSQRFGADVAAHPLRREIVATAATNDLIDRLGPAAPLALAAATGRSMAEVTLGASLLDQACGFDRVWAAIHGFDGRLRGEAQLDLYRRVQRSLRAAIRSLLSTSEALTDPIATARTLGAAWAALPARAPAAGGEMPGDEAALVRTIGDLDRADGLWSIARLAADTGAAVGDAQAALAAVAGELHTQVLRDRAESLVATDVYEARVVTDALAAVARAERQAAAHRLQGKPSAAGRNQIVESVLAEPRLSVAGLVVAANALQAT